MNQWIPEPLAGHLRMLSARLKSRAFRDAATEVGVTVVTATLPVWFFPLMALILIGVSYATTLLDQSISDGELFLYCTSLVGPLLYILFRIYEIPGLGKSHHLKYKMALVLPHGLKFASVVFVVCITSAAIFGLQKINPNFSGVDISKGGYVTLSIVLLVISILALLIATTIRNEMGTYSPSQLMRSEEDTFAKIYKSGEAGP